jgi:putative CocE/NonD family hydrolase
MRVLADHELPHPVTVRPHMWIPMSDGARLAARLWLPEGAGPEAPVPAILEYHPYRKNDHTLAADEQQHRYFAGHGYAAIRVDMRGSGDSDGVLMDEYAPQEQSDGVEIIAWLAAQDWCTGAVGMIGRSWGGFNGLQIAAHRPRALKAIITIASTDDRYAEDVHYSGGCVIASEMLPWANRMLAYNAQPPDPAVVGDSWRQLWLERMEQAPAFVATWLAHQRRDAYWQQGSVCEDYSAIRCPVYAVGGWADPYRNAVFRLMENLDGPRKALVGPWSHISPHSGSPGPLIGFLQECLRWWDHWLKGRETGIMDEPMVRAWINEAVEPQLQSGIRPGRWVAEQAWPARRDEPGRWFPEPSGRLGRDAPGGGAVCRIVGLQHAGADGGTWLSKGTADDLPPDQRAEDGRSLSFTGPELAEPVEILGQPQMRLRVRSDKPLALVAVRLCDVAPDGASLLVTRGLLNLTHRDGHHQVAPLAPGEEYDVVVPLDAIGHAFAPGHRIRVALSPTYWPGAWPSPEPVSLDVVTGPGTSLVLPVRSVRGEDPLAADFREPEGAPAPPVDVTSAGAWRRHVSYEAGSGEHRVCWELDRPAGVRLPDGLEMIQEAGDLFTITEGDPLSAGVQSRWDIRFGRGDWQPRVVAESTMTADATDFHVSCSLEGFEGRNRVFNKAWTLKVPRDGG